MVHELMAVEPDPALQARADRHAVALDLYLARDWDGAIAGFEALLAATPGDGPASVLLDRCRAYAAPPPGPEWTGVFQSATK